MGNTISTLFAHEGEGAAAAAAAAGSGSCGGAGELGRGPPSVTEKDRRIAAVFDVDPLVVCHLVSRLREQRAAATAAFSSGDSDSDGSCHSGRVASSLGTAASSDTDAVYDSEQLTDALLEVAEFFQQTDEKLGSGTVSMVISDLEKGGRLGELEGKLRELTDTPRKAGKAPQPQQKHHEESAPVRTCARVHRDPAAASTASLPDTAAAATQQSAAALMSPLTRDVARLERENSFLRDELSSAGTDVTSLQVEIARLRAERDEATGTLLQEIDLLRQELDDARSQQVAAEIMRQHFEAEAKSLATAVQCVVSDADREVESARVARASTEQELAAARRSHESALRRHQASGLHTRVKACVFDHVMNRGTINFTATEMLGMNPCLTSGWVFEAFTKGCQQLGHDSIMAAIGADAVGVGFHGTPKIENVSEIFCVGLDPSRRRGQAHGPGEYCDLDYKDCHSYAKGCAVMVLLYLKNAPQPPNVPERWRVITNPPRESGLTYMLPVIAIRQKSDAAKPAIPPCARCRAGAQAA